MKQILQATIFALTKWLLPLELYTVLSLDFSTQFLAVWPDVLFMKAQMAIIPYEMFLGRRRGMIQDGTATCCEEPHRVDGTSEHYE